MTEATPTATDQSRTPNEAATAATAAETAVPEGEQPHECPHCGRPFKRERYLVLHRGIDHYESLTEAEREAFFETYDAEAADIRRFRILALGALVLIYFGFLFAYAVFA
ncbi:DUF7410 domain-containing protein [Halegenticoccus soli]|uniref:DUF7410 domain-containing protein n=1 Tax=Halegenticoccus soli TaxID=1985678 RepID=UPI000C6DF395|nr:DNA-binding protein [Halegenticoccus soli]